MKVQALQLNIQHKRVVQSTLLILFILLATYVFLINQTVRQIVERKELESDNSVLGSRVSELEFVYMSHKSDITQERAYENGFFEAGKVTFIPRIPERAIVTLNR